MSGKVFVTGDTHGDYDMKKLSTKNFPEGAKLDREDYLIVTGDFGVLWGYDPENRHEKYLKDWYTNKKGWTTLFIDGNHENHHRLMTLPIEEKFGGTVGVVNESIFHLKRGEIYTICGQTFFTMGGATSWDKGHRLIDVSWWKEEVPNYKETEYGVDNMRKHGSKVDNIITHTIPNQLVPSMGFSKGAESCPVSKYLDFIAMEFKYDNWYAGHFHIDKKYGKFHLLYRDVIQII